MTVLSFDPLNDRKSLVELVDFMGGDHSIVRAARVSYANDEIINPPSEIEEVLTERPSYPFDEDRDSKLIRFLLKHRHGTPFEHNAMTINASLPIIVVRQWHRHRIGWSYNEQSRRYTEENIQIFYPDTWRGQSESNRQASEGTIDNQEYIDSLYRDVTNRAYEGYREMIAAGVTREQARLILPQATYTRMYATMNLRSLMHFVDLRDKPDAQEEMQVYAQAMGEIVKHIFPVTWEIYNSLQ